MPKLRIYEQLLIVYLVAVLVPLVVAAFLITNINQHALREQLLSSATNIAINIKGEVLNAIDDRRLSLFYVNKSWKFIHNKEEKKEFINNINQKFEGVKEIALSDNNGKSLKPVQLKQNSLILNEKSSVNSLLTETIKIENFQKEIFKNYEREQRQIFVLDEKNNVIVSNTNAYKTFNQLKSRLPLNGDFYKPVLVGNSKNQPHIYLKLKEPNWSVLVVTPKNITKYSIIKSRYKIIVALVLTAVSTLLIVVFYALTLRTNIRQLFKGIIAISKGNYKRKIRLIEGFLTPFEVKFLTNEFNGMVEKVDEAYKRLQEANSQLSKLDEMKSNLIDTVSHEFRTPLTCIKGYTGRLLRSDSEINEEERKKSLKVIKSQTDRLSRMVEDLLVIPDIESSLLRVYPEEFYMEELTKSCIEYVKHKKYRDIKFNNLSDNAIVYADQDRTEQILINLLDNAIKYSPDETEINVRIFNNNDYAIIEIINNCSHISEKKINTLFDKFTRVEDNLTRTTRGTGLGLYIAKGLVEAMNGEISIKADDNKFISMFTLPLCK